RAEPPPRTRRAPAAGYAAAVAAPLAALVLSWALEGLLDPNYFSLFLGAVMVASWLDGLRPGLLATALSAALVQGVLTPPRGALLPRTPAEAAKLATFVAVAALVAALNERRLAARAAAEAHAAEAERLARQLQENAVELEQQTEEAQGLNEELEEQIEASERLRHQLEAANARLRAAGAEAEGARERLERMLDTMAEGVVLLDGGGRVTFANAAAGRILGAAPAALVGRAHDDPAFRPLGPEGAPLSPEASPMRRALAGETVHAAELAFARGGATAYLRVSAAPLKGPAGADGGVVATFDDITDAREAAEALRESEARFRALADSAPVLIWRADPTTARVFFNRTWLEFTGRDLEEESGRGWAEGVHPDDYARCLTVYLSSFEARAPFRMEYRLRRRDGEHRWVLDTGVPVHRADGSFAGFVGSCIDITERREAEEQQRFLAEAGTVLASSLDYGETLARVCRLAVPVLADFCVIDLLEADGSLRRVEAAHVDPGAGPLLEALLAFAPHPDSAHPAAEAVRTGEMRVANDVTPEGLAAAVEPEAHQALLRRLGVRAYMAAPLIARGRVLGAILLCITDSGRRYDAAERARAEELARRAAFAIDNARLYEEAVGANRAKADFLAVMSHELRTPLNAVIGYTDLFLAGIPAPLPDPMRPQMLRVQRAAHHLLSLIDEVLTFARLEAGHEEARPAPVAASALAQEAAALVEPMALERGIGFGVRGPDPDFTLVTDARKVRQIVVNLLSNAVEFTPRGSAALSVRREGAEAVFEVADTGVGIAPEQLGRIFDPFWQADQGLRREHGGSGLGLSVSRQLARLLGGDISVASTPGEGSVFTLRLPVRNPSA
ncbi:MAG TPA: PAS domain S-box protein, partial [Longimicrobium sp.]|nr:PAS domain S-box protein [Longimicrobium sp.]